MRLMQGKSPGQEEMSRDEELRIHLLERVVSVKNSIVENDDQHPERSMMMARSSSRTARFSAPS